MPNMDTVTETPEKTEEMAGMFIDDSRRDEIMENYAESEGFNLEAQAPNIEDTGVSPVEETPVPTEEKEYTETTPEEEETATPAESEETLEAEPEVQADEKTVPLGALHEERERRKALQKDVEDLRTKFNQLMDDNQKLMEKKPDTQEVGLTDDLTDYEDPVVKKLYQQVKALTEFKDKTVAEMQVNASDSEAKQVETDINTADRELKEEGYPGFSIAREMVKEKLRKLPDTELRELDNLEGWKKIYREECWPDIKKTFVPVETSDNTEKKIALKEKAGLVAGPGKKPPDPKSEDAKTEEQRYADYLTRRRNAGFS